MQDNEKITPIGRNTKVGGAKASHPKAQTVWQLAEILAGLDQNAQVIGDKLGCIVVVQQDTGAILIADGGTGLAANGAGDEF